VVTKTEKPKIDGLGKAMKKYHESKKKSNLGLHCERCKLSARLFAELFQLLKCRDLLVALVGVLC